MEPHAPSLPLRRPHRLLPQLERAWRVDPLECIAHVFVAQGERLATPVSRLGTIRRIDPLEARNERHEILIGNRPPRRLTLHPGVDRPVPRIAGPRPPPRDGKRDLEREL